MTTWLLILIAYLPFQIALNPVKGIDLSSLRVFIILFFLVFLIKQLKNRRFFFEIDFIGLCLIAFLFASFVSLFNAENIIWGLRKLVYFFSIFPLYFLVRYIVFNSKLSANNFNRKFKKIGLALLGGSFFVSLIGLLQFFAQFIFGIKKVYNFFAINILPVFSGISFSSVVLTYQSWLVNVDGKDFLRAISIFPDSHMLSFYCGMLLPLSIIFVLIYRLSGFYRLFFLIPFLLFFTTLTTFSRGGYFGVIISLILLSVLLFNSYRKTAVVILLSLLIFIVPITPFSLRFCSAFDLSEHSNLERIKIWEKSLDIIGKNVFTGTGLGNYSLNVASDINYRNPITSHNLYLDIFSETGIFGFAILLILGFWIFKNLFLKEKINVFTAGIISSFAYFLSHSFFETPIYHPVVLGLIMIILAITSAYISICGLRTNINSHGVR